MVLAAVVLLVALYYLIGFAVDQIVARISYETEAKLFHNFQMNRKALTEADDEHLLAQARHILEKLTSHPKVPPLPYHLVLMDDEKPNAFAFPGGMIGITTGLMDMLKQDIEIAFVLGHELGHFSNRDHLQGIGRAAGFGIATALLFDLGSGAESFGNMVNFILQRNYSQDREMRADRFGIEMVYAAYGKVEGTDRLFQLLLEEDEIADWAYMFASHPSPKARIIQLKNEALKLKVQ